MLLDKPHIGNGDAGPGVPYRIAVGGDELHIHIRMEARAKIQVLQKICGVVFIHQNAILIE